MQLAVEVKWGTSAFVALLTSAAMAASATSEAHRTSLNILGTDVQLVAPKDYCWLDQQTVARMAKRSLAPGTPLLPTQIAVPCAEVASIDKLNLSESFTATTVTNSGGKLLPELRTRDQVLAMISGAPPLKAEAINDRLRKALASDITVSSVGNQILGSDDNAAYIKFALSRQVGSDPKADFAAVGAMTVVRQRPLVVTHTVYAANKVQAFKLDSLQKMLAAIVAAN